MNKERFLKELEKKLAILSEDEREDTINEYRDIIEEKVKHGKTESESVKEFGSIDELTKEILSAYKINPEFDSKEKTFGDDCEDLIKKGAKKLADVTDNVVDNIKNSDIEFNTQTVFEIAIKVLFALLALAVLKIPFYFITELGLSLFDISFAPFNSILAFIWKFIVEMSYLAICVLLIVNLITKYTKPRAQVKETKEETKENKTEENSTKKKIKNNYFSEFIILLIKIFVVVCFLFPIWLGLIGLAVLIAIAVYFICKGALMYGILILLIGIFMFMSSFASLIFNLVFNNKKITFFPFLISIIVCIVGGFLSLDYVSEFKYYNTLPEDEYKSTTSKYDYMINGETTINDEIKIVENNELEDNKIIVEITYYNNYLKPEVVYLSSENSLNINYYTVDHNVFEINNQIIDDIKNKTIYNYNLLENYNITVYANTNTINYLK